VPQVPKNERGNVECPPLAKQLPGGTVHLQLAGVGHVCRALAVDFAPALVGFDLQAGRMVPRLDGAVICKVGEAAAGLGWAGLGWAACCGSTRCCGQTQTACMLGGWRHQEAGP
jgi:hypothetical protein